MRLFHLLFAVGLFILIRSFIGAVAPFDLWFFDFFTLLPRFLLCKALRGEGAAGHPREYFCPSRSKVSRPGSIEGAPLQSVPHGHRCRRSGNGGPQTCLPAAWLEWGANMAHL